MATTVRLLQLAMSATFGLESHSKRREGRGGRKAKLEEEKERREEMEDRSEQRNGRE